MDQSVIDKIVRFINSIGIPCHPVQNEGDTFLPGIFISEGRILYNPELLKFPGDLLHEAGHIAILLPKDRAIAQSPDEIFGDLNKDGAEMAAIAWSWAALMHLELAPAILFHEHGYRGSSESLIDNFSKGQYIGVPMLHWIGMSKGNNCDNPPNEDYYPQMKHWTRQE